MTGFQAPVPAEALESALQRVFARAELRQRENLLQRFIEWLDIEPSQGKLLGDILVGSVIALALVGLALALRAAWHGFRKQEEQLVDGPGGARVDAGLRIRELAAEARAARAAGDLRLALRLTFQAVLLALGGRGDLEWRAAWTNRELLRRGRPSKATLELLEPLVRELEPKEFGRAAVSEADVERLEALLAPHLARAGGAS